MHIAIQYQGSIPVTLDTIKQVIQKQFNKEIHLVRSYNQLCNMYASMYAYNHACVTSFFARVAIAEHAFHVSGTYKANYIAIANIMVVQLAMHMQLLAMHLRFQSCMQSLNNLYLVGFKTKTLKQPRQPSGLRIAE